MQEQNKTTFSFKVINEDSKYFIFLNQNSTLKELLHEITLILPPDLSINNFELIISNHGEFSTNDLSIKLDSLELNINQEHLIFLQNKKHPEHKWNTYCTKKIIKDNNTPQIVYSVNNLLVCFACRYYCNHDKKYNTILDHKDLTTTCQCNDSTCLFKKCTDVTDEQTIKSNKDSIVSFHEMLNYLSFKKFLDVNDKTSRIFSFKQSAKFCLQRINFYEESEIQKEVLSIVPLQSLHEKALINSKTNNTDYKDELVKSLLQWYKSDCMTWLNSPKCTNCNENTIYHDTNPPTIQEAKYAAIRAEVYICNKCSNLYRFPRYNNPAIICQTKFGRCSEYANLFGSILRALDYDVRFVDNFEDHVWNEYWSQSLQKWIHVDSCENAWDTPLMYEQGWGRVMSFIVASSIYGIYDVTKRYIKTWSVCEERRTEREVSSMINNILECNKIIRMNFSNEKLDLINKRDILEVNYDFDKVKLLKEEEKIGRISGSEEWRLERGEYKK